MTIADYLNRPSAEKVLLANIDGTHYLADSPYITEPGDTPGNQPYAPVIEPDGIPRLRRSIQEVFGGRSMASWGSLRLATHHVAGVDLTAAALRGAPVALAITGPRAAVDHSDALTVLTGTCGVRSIDADGGMEIEIEDIQSTWRDIELPPTRYDASAMPPGFPGANDGRHRPVAFGVCRNVSPVLIDVATYTYEFDANGAAAVDAVYDNGVAVAYTDNGDGTASLTSPPAGLITGDVTGPYGTTPALIEYLATAYGGLDVADIDATGLPSDTIGLYISLPTTLDETITRLVRGCLGWWGFNRASQLVARQFAAPAGGGPTFGETKQLGPVTAEEEVDLYASASALYRRNWTRMEPASSVALDTVQWLRSEGQETVSTGGTGTKPAPRIDTYFDTEAAAAAIAALAVTLFGVQRMRVSMTVPITVPLLDLGTDISITDTLMDGDYVVIGITDTWDGEVPLFELEAWG